jgi:hypothetical protein
MMAHYLSGYMDVRVAIAALAIPQDADYYASRIPSPYDSQIGRGVRAFSEASPGRQAALREAVDDERAGLLVAWSERMAAIAVRLDSDRPLVLGLVGLTLAAEADGGEAYLAAPLHRRSAEKLGSDADRLFDEAAGATDLMGARWLRDAREMEEQPEDSGYVEDSDEDGFRYLRTADVLRRWP